jgi:ATP-dependent Clp endopeptidase proteolytic subunit ClpP
MAKLIELPVAYKGLRVINRTETIAEVLLYGDIGDSFFDETAVSATQFTEALKKIPKSVKEIHLRVNSPGGSVFDGMTIYERIKSERANGRRVVAYIDGLAASIASIIVQAADEIIVGDGSFIMIHKPLVGVYGNSLELDRMISILDKIEEQMISIYAKKTGLSRVEIANALAAETWYTSKEALELGLADRQFDVKDTLQIAASMIKNCRWIKNKPELQNSDSNIREKLRAFITEAKSYLGKK